MRVKCPECSGNRYVEQPTGIRGRRTYVDCTKCAGRGTIEKPTPGPTDIERPDNKPMATHQTGLPEDLWSIISGKQILQWKPEQNRCLITFLPGIILDIKPTINDNGEPALTYAVHYVYKSDGSKDD